VGEGDGTVMSHGVLKAWIVAWNSQGLKPRVLGARFGATEQAAEKVTNSELCRRLKPAQNEK
jgi:hypothetical protein